MFGIPAFFPKEMPVMHPNEIGAAVAQFHAHNIYGWPLLGGGYKHVSQWAEEQRARYDAALK